MSQYDRRTFLKHGLTASLLATTGPACAPSADEGSSESEHPGTQGDVAAFELDEMSLTDLGEAMESGRFTSRAITEMYLERIEALNRQGPELYAVLETNPDAPEIAEALDREAAESGRRGPLHGIPLLLKDL